MSIKERLFGKPTTPRCAKCGRDLSQYSCQVCGRIWCSDCRADIGTGKGWCKDCEKEKAKTVAQIWCRL